MAKKYKDFESIYKWNVKDLYKSDEYFLKEIDKLNKDIKKYKKYNGIIMSNASILLELLEFDKNVSLRLERSYIYAHINNDVDTLNTHYQEIYGIAKNTYMKMGSGRLIRIG